MTGRKSTVRITPRPRNGRFRREAQIRLNTSTTGTSDASFTTAAARCRGKNVSTRSTWWKLASPTGCRR